MIKDALRERYLRDPLPIRLGNLASSLARIASCSENPKNHEVVTSVLEESKYFASGQHLKRRLKFRRSWRRHKGSLRCGNGGGRLVTQSRSYA